MSTANLIARQDQDDAKEDGQRRCIVLGEMRDRHDLIRFVVSPDARIVADFSQKLPGRGLWVSAERGAIDLAVSKNLFAKAAKQDVLVDPELTDIVAAHIKARTLNLLGLAKGAGIATLGQPQVEAAVKTGRVSLLIVANDASPTNLAEREEALRSLTRQELGSALGYEQVVYVGLKAHSLTEKLRHSLIQLEKIAQTRHLPVNTDSRKQ